ncbi:PepSY-associated TM helix domain-containing protein [Sphingobium sp. HBC34]|uniref:PepSY-associated TM helix domain-containing protein n=1 Tax=Sphingobium cyanobacteriorum TaxID=3063954 RepID=A0ABT8ZLQ5_9SPHN|nr:PepSY-associated TM helix domain-containing protein [Sphingobium sp. HBC34]MDO7835474.1 PepSY-associated TM helix domain-containing protein [Sphingobium sp. HBC34]
MSMIRNGARQCMAWLHGWTGLLLGHVLFIMCLAGTLSIFRPEIGRWMRPERIGAADPHSALLAATTWLSTHATGATGWYLTAPDDRSNSVEATYDSGGAYLSKVLDPVSGAPVARDTLGGEFFYRLHFELELPYPWGRLLASLAAMLMLVAIITGIIAHKRIFKDIFTFRPAKGQRSWLDGHNALGVLSLPFHIMITFTGLLTLASLNMPWGMTAAYGENLTALYADLTPGAVSRAASGTRAPLAPIAPMLDQARRYFGAPVGRVYIFHPGDAAAVVTLYPVEDKAIGYLPAEMSFDGATGRLLKAWTEKRAGMRAYQTIYGLHMAHFASGLTRWLYFLGGAMLSLAIASGMALWIVKRRERAPLSIGNQVLERLNVGGLVGVPIGMAAFPVANRLLPLTLPMRSDAEVSVALCSAGAAMLLGLILPPALGWPWLLGILAACCAAAALIGPVWTSDSVLLTGNILLLTIAAASVLLIGKQVRRTPAPAPVRRRVAPA